MAIRKLKNGNYQVDYTDESRGIPRTRKNFGTKREAEQYETALKSQAHDNLLGRRKRRLFGEALTRYLEEVSPQKKDHAQTLRLVAAMRWPVRVEGKWITLEHTPLEAPPGQLSIATAMQHWRTDMQAILKRVYIENRHWHLRRSADGEHWYEQPAAEDGNIPAHRVLITDPARIAQLNTIEGRGPYAPQTLRIRQALVRAVLKCAWKDWDWMTQDLRGKIHLESTAGNGRQLYLQNDELRRLLAAAKESSYGDHLAHAMLGAVLIGWRKSNLLNLKWGDVVFPIYDATGEETQCGYIIAAAAEVKTGVPLQQPMSEALLSLLRDRWNLRNGQLVFHRGDGQPLQYFRRAWESIKAKAEVNPDLRWHDFRHTWASYLAQAGATDRQLMELAGWKSTAMAKTYAHLRIDHLRSTVNLIRPIDFEGQ